MSNDSQKVDVLAVLHFMASNDWDGDALPGNEAVDAAISSVIEMISALKQIAKCAPQQVINLNAKIGASDSIGWNYQSIATSALARVEDGA